MYENIKWFDDSDVKKKEEQEGKKKKMGGGGGKKDGNKLKTRIMLTTCPSKASLSSMSES